MAGVFSFWPERLRLDLEGTVTGETGFLLLHAVDFRPTGPAMQYGSKFRKTGFRADRIDLHAPVIQITDIPGKAEFACRALDEVAEADALHTAANQPAARDLLAGRHSGPYAASDVSRIS